MGTRGAIGFRINETDKVTYNHFDSYPDGLGDDVIKFITQNSIGVMKAAAENIELVDSRSTPTDEQISQYEKYANTSVSTQDLKEWYVLLRQTQGQLQPFVEDLKYMINSTGFLLDSLFCEYAYIINLDTNKLEFYKGFNKNKGGAGRYASLSLKDPAEYYGVELIAEFELANIQAEPEGNWVEQMTKLTQEDEEYDE